MHKPKKATGHLLALFTVFVWGTTFIATKLLLQDFQPVDILLYRFLIGYLMLWIIHPHRLKRFGLMDELHFLIAGASGVSIYFLCENFALTYTYASNVSILVAIAPLLTGLLAQIFMKEKIHSAFYIGFLLSIVGIAVVSLNGTTTLYLNPKGDLLALAAACCWAVYSIMIIYINRKRRSSIAITRRIFFYGLLTMIPALYLCDYRFQKAPLLQPKSLALIFYLGIVASGLCYISWNKAMECLGAVKTSVYIYLIPVITLVFSYFVLHERLTAVSIIGCVMILFGLFVSEKK